MFLRSLLLSFVAFLVFAMPVAGDERAPLLVAAAADLKFALDDVLARFAREEPDIHTKVTYGSSGSLFAQIDNGAPFDLFLSADAKFPLKLIEAGKAEKESLFKYARGHLVVWVPKESKLEIGKGMQVLLDPTVRKVAIANPDVAPYGAAAVAAMKAASVYDAVKPKLVLGENVAQALQFIESGAADTGVIALSLALAPPLKEKGRYWEVPTDSFPALQQAGVIRTGAAQRDLAMKLRAFIISPAGREVLRGYGFLLPDETR
jgi:molybdate transport system substrate-binding protein